MGALAVPAVLALGDRRCTGTLPAGGWHSSCLCASPCRSLPRVWWPCPCKVAVWHGYLSTAARLHSGEWAARPAQAMSGRLRRENGSMRWSGGFVHMGACE